MRGSIPFQGNPEELDVAVELKDGTPARLRAIRRNDKAGLVEAFRNLEPSTIYTRFFGFKKMLSENELDLATTFDPDKLVSIVVTIGHGLDETIIGNGVYVVSTSVAGARGDEPAAEVAFVVEEDYQGRGIAGLLLRALSAIARGRGLKRFEADVLPANGAMLHVFANSGLPMVDSMEDGDIHVSLML
ncbi:MAG: hypothetical protein APF80_06485 [Alphaproteobacteria bacterium BRH_c36]|nr:MAG: hypothetical protein APF80_06485 [Alphaproteobacteria bacterium BRH_c36]